ncbi:MAG: DMT family transporter [Alphaproteobacteria bacterium]
MRLRRAATVPPSALRDAVGGTKTGAAPSPRAIRNGILCIIGAALLFTSSHAAIKLEASTFHVVQIVFFRSLFAFVPLAPFLWRSGVDLLKTSRPALHAGRCVAGITSMFAYFYALGFLPLADLTAINFTMPLFVTALSVPLLAERVGWRRWTAVAVGFGGVLLITRPGGGMLDPMILIALFSAFGYAVAVICMRRLGSTESSATTTFYFTAAGAVVSGALLPFVWQTPSGVEWAVLIGIGVVSGGAQLMMTFGYRQAPAAIVAPFDYVALVWAALLGFVIWGDVPTVWVVSGAAIVIASGLYILRRETKLARERARADAAASTPPQSAASRGRG